MRGFCVVCLYHGSHWAYGEEQKGVDGESSGIYLWECPCCHTVRTSATPYLGPTLTEPELDVYPPLFSEGITLDRCKRTVADNVRELEAQLAKGEIGEEEFYGFCTGLRDRYWKLLCHYKESHASSPNEAFYQLTEVVCEEVRGARL